MKNKFKSALVFTIIFTLALGSTLHAQSVYKINDSKDIDMKLSGTSTLHKWAMDAKTFSGSADFTFKSPGQLSSLTSLTFALAVADLKSGESGLDKNAYKALNAKEYKDITYKLLSATITTKDGGKYLIKAHGDLTIAGVTKEVLMDVSCSVNKDGTITCTGSQTLNMTDYAVKPPKFMLGAMKTGDAITLDFTLVYKKA
ncbi:YceI family protein [Mucilaginibacter sp. X4EP1]|jgi:polyisoprenoid-binding protein YceI|uniref:YceI family protein n=1 Tax=Mucilaginibacter sp. X4EP1 TaxID=2723092 RepID=UPI002166D511|nr:YceI family protein [Mucilaginibacter sp. X4EP1]MCS3813032.1 polyisoprenoid-binding protein YceI [Mucilaginibacter sp. X4EP1]